MPLGHIVHWHKHGGSRLSPQLPQGTGTAA